MQKQSRESNQDIDAMVGIGSESEETVRNRIERDDLRGKHDLCVFLLIVMGVGASVLLMGNRWSLLGLVSLYIGLAYWFSLQAGRKKIRWWLVVAMLAQVQWSIVSFALIYQDLGLVVGEETIDAPDFWTAYYFSGTTWTTIGYGDICPTPKARFVATTEATFGYVTMGILLVVVMAMFDRIRHVENDLLLSDD